MKPRVLIFDDDPLIRQMLWALCDRRGYEVITFPDPGFCPLHVGDRCPCESGTTCADIIISDLDMPRVKGLDFLQTLLDKGCRCQHIALVSGSWSASDIVRAHSLGCKTFGKPFHVDQIVKWLEQAERELPSTRTLHKWSLFRHSAKP